MTAAVEVENLREGTAVGGAADDRAGPLEPGKEYDFKIIKISHDTRRIGLSYRAAVRQQERREIDQYKSSKSSATATIGDAMKQKLNACLKAALELP